MPTFRPRTIALSLCSRPDHNGWFQAKRVLYSQHTTTTSLEPRTERLAVRTSSFLKRPQRADWLVRVAFAHDQFADHAKFCARYANGPGGYRLHAETLSRFNFRQRTRVRATLALQKAQPTWPARPRGREIVTHQRIRRLLRLRPGAALKLSGYLRHQALPLFYVQGRSRALKQEGRAKGEQRTPASYAERKRSSATAMTAMLAVMLLATVRSLSSRGKRVSLTLKVDRMLHQSIDVPL